MKLPTEVLSAAVEALNAAEDTNHNIELTRAGAARYTIMDRSKLPGAQVLWEGDDYTGATVELDAICDARRIVAVAELIAKYERARVWAAALEAVHNALVPDPESIPEDTRKRFAEMPTATLITSAAKHQRGICAIAVEEAAENDQG